MISYKPFWETLKKSSETTYTLIHKYNISSATIDRLRRDKPLSTITIDDLCRILHCGIEGIATYVPQKERGCRSGLTIKSRLAFPLLPCYTYIQPQTSLGAQQTRGGLRYAKNRKK